MPVSGVTDWSMTALDAVTYAMREIGVLGVGKSPKATELTDGIFLLNSMLKTWQADGVSLWRENDRQITITANAASVDLDSANDDIRQIFSARLIGDYERTLGQWERDDYLSLPNKNTAGDPTIFYVSRGRDNLTVYFWPVPTANAIAKLDCERIVDTVTDGSEAIDVPQAWHETVVVCLAARMGRYGPNPAILAGVQQRAGELYARLKDDDRPQSVFIGAC